MKYCPGTTCSHRMRCGTPAEFEDRIVVCADCGMDLVEDPAVALAGVAPVVTTETRGYRVPANPNENDDARQRARTDVTTGIAFIAASVVLLPLLTYFVGGGSIAVGTGPFFYGFYRLARGLGERK